MVSAQNPYSVLHHTRNSLAGFGPFQKLFLSRRTHVSMFWLEGESKTHHPTAYDPNDSN
jgi:hypothetical protein